jgi:Domain of unknown function (DUF2828)
MSNLFIEGIQQIPTGATENGALAYSDTFSNLLNYFSNCNNFYRDYSDVEKDLNKCWAENSELTLKLIGYIRAISRTDNYSGLKVKGLGLKHEGRLCLKWLYLNHPLIFHKNLETFIVNLGSWQDLWHRDLGCWMINKDPNVIKFIIDQLYIRIATENQNDLCLKYLPRHKSISNIKKRSPGTATLNFHIARNNILYIISHTLNIEFGASFTVKDLMKWKASGTLHTWQQHISNKNFNGIDFNRLPGKVLQWITKDKDGSSFLSRHNLEEKYIKWLDSKDTINNTSYIYELVKPIIVSYKGYNTTSRVNKITEYTVEKQIAGMLSKVEKSALNVMPVIDTSGSMNCEVHRNTSALDICLSLGVYFSMIQYGSFKDHIISFDTKSKFIKLQGSYIDRLKDILGRQDFMGSTNFQSVINLVLQTRKNNPNIPIEDYPDVYLVISDMQFDVNSNRSQTNHQEAVAKLIEVGLKEPLFIWYNVSPYGNDNFQNHKDDSGVINMSGFDPSALNRLLSQDFQLKFEDENNKSIKEITPLEGMFASLNQEYLELLKL